MKNMSKNFTRIKNTVLLSAMVGASVLFSRCGDAGSEPTPGNGNGNGNAKTETLVTKTQDAVVGDVRNATKMLGDAKVSGVVLDMRGLSALQLGNAELSTAIDALVSAATANPSKSIRVMVPQLSINGKVAISPKFYEMTRGSNVYNPTTRGTDGTTMTPATIVIQDDGTLHFSGELQSSELLSVLSAMQSRDVNTGEVTETTPQITADRIRVTERMGTAADGPAYGLPLWAIFDLVKTDEIVAGKGADGRGFDGSGSVLFGHLGNTGRTELNDADNLMFYDLGDDELRRSSTPAKRRADARVVFDKPINMTSEFFTDTVRMGGAWNNGKWTPDADNWLNVIAESQTAYGRPYIVYPKGFLQMTPEQRKEQHRLIIHTEGKAAGADTVINGIKRDWVNLEEIIAFNTTVLTGNGTIKWRPGKPLVVRVPTERTPAELKEPTSTGELHSWDNYMFYDCRINIDWLPGKIAPFAYVVDPNMKLNLTRANQVRTMTRAAAQKAVNTRKR